MGATVLLFGNDSFLATCLEERLGEFGITVRQAPTPYDTEGIGVDVVVLDNGAQLSDVHVHPRLYATPVVLVAPGKSLRAEQWQAVGVWPVTAGRDILKNVTAAILGILSETSQVASLRGPGEVLPQAASPQTAEL
jgi:hypothetical protein